MKSINLSDIKIKGDLAVRSGLNFSRLEGKWYRPEEVFKADSHGWPADWEGRIILALTLLEQSTHRTSAYLDEIVSLIPSHLNQKGYFGPILPEGVFDEQHFGGHSWILRALVAYYQYKKEQTTLEILVRMVKAFLLPVKGSFAKYPIVPVKRFTEQGPWILSKLQTKTKHHAETSDAGCAFIMIDGATSVYELFKWPELHELIIEMIDRFMEMDLEALHIQTHATLSATRGILRFYETTGDSSYLDKAVKRYELYKKTAWTEAFGNYNWFGAPRWTEPCAIIDSFIVAITLWKHTHKAEYLNDAHLIYFNALSHGNRINGSFGTDICCGAKDAEQNKFLAPINFETYWCCTMRGGEGLTLAIEYSFFTEDDTILVPLYQSCQARVQTSRGIIVFDETTKYPHYDKVSLKVTESSLEAPVNLKLFVPVWSNHVEVKVNGTPYGADISDGFISMSRCFERSDTIELSFDFSVKMEKSLFENSITGYHKYMYGPMLLGAKTDVMINSLDGNRFENYAESKYQSSEEIQIPPNPQFERISDNEFRISGTGIILSGLCSVRDLTCEDTMRQILFPD